MFFNHIRRKTNIAKVLTKHGFGLLVVNLGFGHLVPFHWGLLGHKRRKEPYRPEEHLRLAFEELGTTFIKLGQILSVRPDLLPESYIHELSKLQDRVPPATPEDIKRVVEKELGGKVEDLFDYFEEEPLASASIGQVHRARLKDGKRVVLKVQKPYVERQVEEDLAILEEVAHRIARLGILKNIDVISLFEEFAYTIRNELDYTREGRNADTFRKNFAEEKGVYIPKVYWDYTTKRVLCMEEVEGVKITDLQALESMGVHPSQIAKKGARIYIQMIFKDGFYHADPHPGNFLIMKDGRIALLDFGMVGTLDSMGRLSLFQLNYGIVNNDIDLVVDALLDLGVSIDPRKEAFFKRELEILFSYYLLQPMREIKISKLLDDTLKLSRKYGMRIPSDLFLLLKTLALAEGIGMSLDPNFRLIKELAPFVKKGFRQVILPFASKREALRMALLATKMAIQAVPKGKRLLNNLERGKLGISIDYMGEERFLRDLRRDINRLSLSIITLGFMIASALILLALSPHLLKDYIVYGLVLLTLLMVAMGFVKLRES